MNLKKQSYTYSFEYCDNLINIGPCGYAIVGEGDSEETRLLQRNIPPQYQTTQLDLVTTSGTNKCGSVSILQQTIKPELITTQALPGAIDMWTVYSSKPEHDQKAEHSFILIGQETSTLIFQTGIDITELEQGGFLTNEQTIYCGNIDEKLIVQVTRLHIVLLRDSLQLQIISCENNPIRFATSLDRYLAILTTHGVIYIYIIIKDDNKQPKLLEYYKLNDKKYTSVATIEPMNSSNIPPTTNSLPTENNPTNVIPITRWLIAISKDGTLTMHELMIDEIIPATIHFEIARFNSALKTLVDIQDTTPSMTNYQNLPEDRLIYVFIV